jgi:nucleotide-binding universal stress UspA family protein
LKGWRTEIAMKIVAATDFSTRSNRALRQAGLLARAQGAQLDIVHVVDDDQPERMIETERREAERTLREQISSMPEWGEIECRELVVAGDPFDGILRAAAAAGADLIVMGTHRKQLLRDIFVGTTVERVIRTGPFPVLMVSNEAQRHYTNVLAPIDLEEPSAHALRVARSVGLAVDGRTTLLHAFEPVAKGKMALGGADKASIDGYVASEREHWGDEVVKFLIAHDLAPQNWSVRLDEGGAMEAITRVVAEMRPDLLVMGTHGRGRLLKALIGSVTEEVLRSLDVDVLAVPPGAARS